MTALWWWSFGAGCAVLAVLVAVIRARRRAPEPLLTMPDLDVRSLHLQCERPDCGKPVDVLQRDSDSGLLLQQPCGHPLQLRYCCSTPRTAPHAPWCDRRQEGWTDGTQ